MSLTSPSRPAIDMTGTSSPAEDALLLMLRLGSCTRSMLSVNCNVSNLKQQGRCLQCSASIAHISLHWSVREEMSVWQRLLLQNRSAS